jgi:hypothetical protein
VGVRNAEDGRVAGTESRYKTLLVDVAKRGRNPKEGALARKGRGRHEVGRTL